MKIEDLQKIVDARHPPLNSVKAKNAVSLDFTIAFNDHADEIMEVLRAASNPDLIDFGFTGEHLPDAMDALRSALEKVWAK